MEDSKSRPHLDSPSSHSSVGGGSTTSIQPLQSTRQAMTLYLRQMREWLLYILYHSRDILESFLEAWGYIWLFWLQLTGLQEGYWYTWWYCIPLDLIMYLLYPIFSNLGTMKCTILVLKCHLLALPIIRATYPGLRSQARDAMRHVHDTCLRGIQNLRAKVQGCVLLLKFELSKRNLLLLGEGYEFEKDKLIQLWMAAGFIEYGPLEIYGADYFEKLISKGYILRCSDSDFLYKVNSEKVSSDLGETRDKSNYLRLESTRRQSNAAPTNILHVSVACDGINDKIFKTLRKFNRLRTLLFYGSRIKQVPLDLFLSFKSLVVLDLSRTDIKELPSSALEMIHLRYLDLSWTLIELLPETITRFQRLQTLKLRGCSYLWRLPREMKRLTQLRHLDFDVLGQLTVMPKGMGALVNLRTLSAFIVGAQGGCKIGELRDLNNLMGEFCIARLENVQSAHDAEMASLSAKKNLKKLELRWSDFPLQERKNEDVDGSVLRNLCPHSDLEELLIRCYGGINFPSWIGIESFHKLASITLFKCEHVSILPSMQKLPSLEYLGLISLNSVVEMGVRGEMDQVAFPKLERLIIDGMLNLNTWFDGKLGDYPCLVELAIKDCPKLPELPSFVYFSTLKRLEISSCPEVRFVEDRELPTSLEFLSVEDCPLIKESCLEEDGKSWDKIRHVRNVLIDQEANLDGTDDDDDDIELLDEDIRQIEDDDREELPIVEESILDEEGNSLDKIKHVQNVLIGQEAMLDGTDDDDIELLDQDIKQMDDDVTEELPIVEESCLEEEGNSLGEIKQVQSVKGCQEAILDKEVGNSLDKIKHERNTWVDQEAMLHPSAPVLDFFDSDTSRALPSLWLFAEALYGYETKVTHCSGSVVMPELAEVPIPGFAEILSWPDLMLISAH